MKMKMRAFLFDTRTKLVLIYDNADYFQQDDSPLPAEDIARKRTGMSRARDKDKHCSARPLSEKALVKEGLSVHQV